MRWWGLWVLCGACDLSDSPEPGSPILTIAQIESDCATQPMLEDQWITEWIGLPEGCSVTITLTLDADRMPANAFVQYRTPNSGSSETLEFDANNRAPVTFMGPMLGPSGWRDADANFSYGIYEGTNPVRTLEYDNLTTIIVRPSAAPSAWLWDSYWFNENRDGQRFYDPDCDDPISVVMWVGGTPAPDTRLEVTVWDVDVGTDTALETGSVPVGGPGRHTYAPTHLCDPDREGATADNVDPRYDVRILDAADAELDSQAGPEIDL